MARRSKLHTSDGRELPARLRCPRHEQAGRLALCDLEGALDASRCHWSFRRPARVMLRRFDLRNQPADLRQVELEPAGDRLGLGLSQGGKRRRLTP